jgi:large subunit ribosomal protein L4
MEAISYKVVGGAGEQSGSINLDSHIFNGKILHDVVHATVRWQLVRRRAGTHSALTRSMMKGGAKKPWRQKGTGRARAGSSISPHWVGGAVVHGPLPREYSLRVSRRSRRQALISVLSDKRAHDRLVIVDEIPTAGERRTKHFAAFLRGVGLEGKSVTILTGQEDHNLRLAARNIPSVLTLPLEGVNVYDLLKHEYVLASRGTIEGLQERIRNSEGRASAL